MRAGLVQMGAVLAVGGRGRGEGGVGEVEDGGLFAVLTPRSNDERHIAQLG